MAAKRRRSMPVIEYRSPANDSWYAVCLRSDGDDVLHLMYLNFAERFDELFCAMGSAEGMAAFSSAVTLGLPRDVDDFAARFRPQSLQAQDSDCRNIAVGTAVCAVLSLGEKELRYYDATIVSVRHLIHGEGVDVCRCAFQILWQHGPKKGERTSIDMKSLCLIQNKGSNILDATLLHFLELARKRLASNVDLHPREEHDSSDKVKTEFVVELDVSSSVSSDQVVYCGSRRACDAVDIEEISSCNWSDDSVQLVEGPSATSFSKTCLDDGAEDGNESGEPIEFNQDVDLGGESAQNYPLKEDAVSCIKGESYYDTPTKSSSFPAIEVSPIKEEEFYRDISSIGDCEEFGKKSGSPGSPKNSGHLELDEDADLGGESFHNNQSPDISTKGNSFLVPESSPIKPQESFYDTPATGSSFLAVEVSPIKKQEIIRDSEEFGKKSGSAKSSGHLELDEDADLGGESFHNNQSPDISTKGNSFLILESSPIKPQESFYDTPATGSSFLAVEISPIKKQEIIMDSEEFGKKSGSPKSSGHLELDEDADLGGESFHNNQSPDIFTKGDSFLVPGSSPIKPQESYFDISANNNEEVVDPLDNHERLRFCGNVYGKPCSSPERLYFICVDNLEKSLSPLQISEFLFHKASISCHAFVFPSLSKEPSTRGAIFVENSEMADKIYDFLCNPCHVVISSKGRPWVVVTKKGWCGFMDGQITKYEQRLQNGTKNFSDAIKLAYKGTDEYEASKKWISLIMEYYEHLEGLRMKLTLEEMRLKHQPST